MTAPAKNTISSAQYTVFSQVVVFFRSYFAFWAGKMKKYRQIRLK